MTTPLPFPARRDSSSLALHLRATTAPHLDRPDEHSRFGVPEIAWCRSPAGMELVRLGASDESDRVLVTLDRPWQPLRDPWSAIAAILEEAELEYEATRPIEPHALVVSSQDGTLGLAPAGGGHQAADLLALARSGLAFWRRIAVRTGYDPTCLERFSVH